MVNLQEKDMIAWSKTRKCYLHPEDPERVIKIVRKKKQILKRDANWQEWTHYQHIKQRYPQLDFISTYHGYVETNLGRGLLIDCIRDSNGQVSMRLGNVLENRKHYDLESVEKALNLFCQDIIEKNIQLFDLNMFNILVQVLPDRKYRLVCVDIKGRYNNYELIPVSSYIPFFSRQKLKRRCRNLMQIVQKARQNQPIKEE